MMTELCSQCPYRDRPKVPPEGDPSTAKYVLIGEAPAYDEVRKGRPFIGKTGRLLMAFLQRMGIQREECYLTNALKCSLPKGKRGYENALAVCRHNLAEELKQINPDAQIAIMGGIAKEAIWPYDKAGMLASRGWRRLGNRWVYLMVHPAFYNYNPDEAPMFLTDLKRLKRGKLEAPSVAPVIIGSYKELVDLLYLMARIPRDERDFVAFDLETDQVDFQRDRILCMSISFEYGTAYIIPDSLLYEDGNIFYTGNWTKQVRERFLDDLRYYTGKYLRPDEKTVRLLYQLFAIPGYRWVGHNAKFDLRFLIGQLGVDNAHVDFDTIVAHYTLDERKGGHALKPLADDYFDSGDYEAELFEYISKKSARYSRVPRHVLYQYNAMDTELTLRLAYALERDLKRKGLYERPFMFPMMEALPMLLNAELEGMAIDWSGLDKMEKEEIEPELDRLRTKLREISGHPDLNPLSSQKVNNIVYDELKFPIIEVRTRAAGKRIKARSSQQAVMDGWAKMYERGELDVSEIAWSFIETLREYRHVRKMQGSYVRKWRRYRGTDSRVHTSFLLRGTVTGRLSAKDPPMQTIPSKITEKWGLMVSGAHIARPGYKLLYADYSQAELMVAACLAQDQFMLQAFRKEGADYHSEVALAAYGPNYTKDDRQACKRLTFGWLYGGNVYEIAMNALQFEGPVAERFAKEWDELFKTTVEWRANQAKLMLRQGYIESPFGRRRRQLLLTRENVGKAQRIAMNAPIQSTVSDLNLISATRLYRRYIDDPEVNVILLIHDSIVMEVIEHKVGSVKQVMHDTMVGTGEEFFPDVKFKADVKVLSNLSEAS